MTSAKDGDGTRGNGHLLPCSWPCSCSCCSRSCSSIHPCPLSNLTSSILNHNPLNLLLNIIYPLFFKTYSQQKNPNSLLSHTSPKSEGFALLPTRKKEKNHQNNKTKDFNHVPPNFICQKRSSNCLL